MHQSTSTNTAATHYETLGVARSATLIEIRDAYKTLSRLHHPDAGENSDPEKFKAVAAAYKELSDAEKKGEYDRGLERRGIATNSILVNHTLFDQYPELALSFISDRLNPSGEGSYGIKISCLKQERSVITDPSYLEQVRKRPYTFSQIDIEKPCLYSDIPGKINSEVSVRLAPPNPIQEQEAVREIMVKSLGRLGANIIPNSVEHAQGEIHLIISRFADPALISTLESAFRLANKNESEGSYNPYPIRTTFIIAEYLKREYMSPDFMQYLLKNLNEKAVWAAGQDPHTKKLFPAINLTDSPLPDGFGSLGFSAATASKFYRNTLKSLAYFQLNSASFKISTATTEDGQQKQLAVIKNNTLLHFLQNHDVLEKPE